MLLRLLALAVVPILPGAMMAAQPCASCHPKEVAGYEQSAMSHSLSRPGKEPEGSFRANGKTFTIVSDEKGVRQRMEQRGQTVEFPIAFVIGSGKRGRGYLIQLGEELFQSPIGYYPSRKAYDLAPGFERLNPDFTRPVTAECLDCHAGKVLAVAGSVNRYEPAVFSEEAISCERCHGPSEAHLKNPGRGTIVNPAKLPPAARDSVCEQCHLSGLTRVLNPGRRVEDFVPGRRLEEIFTTYVAAPEPAPDLKDSTDGFKTISHSEQLALSLCARSSNGNLSCATCHDPHKRAAETPEYFAGRCLSCHQGKLASGHPAGADCVSCHMAQRTAFDGAHSVFTDHRIQRRPLTTPGPAPRGAVEITPWRAPADALAARNLALAYLNLGLENGSTAELSRGQQMLTAVIKDFPDDAQLWGALGRAYSVRRQSKEAIAAFERVEKLSPGDVRNEENLGRALLAAGEQDRGAEHLERALDLNPLLLPVANTLSGIYRREGNTAKLTALAERMRDAAKYIQ